MSKFLYPIYKLNIESYKKWWLYHKKAGGSGILSEILQGFSFNLENTLNRKFKLFEIEGNSVQDGSPSPDNEVPILSSGENGSINEKIQNKNVLDYKEMFNNAEDYSSAFKIYRKKLQPNTSYTTSSNFPYTNNETGFIVVNSTDEPSTVNYGLRGEITTTTNSDGIIRIYIRKFSGQQILPNLENFESGTYYIQTELGSTSSSYVEHKEQDYSIFVQQPFRSNKDKTIRDCFVKKSDNKKYERHFINEITLDGTENWSRSDTEGFIRYVVTFANMKSVGATRSANILCNKFKGSIENGYGNCFAFNNTVAFYVPENIENFSDWKNWLEENNVKLQYELETPLELPCTETQIQQLENKPSTYKDFTIIQSQDETPAYLKIQYWKEVQS